MRLPYFKRTLLLFLSCFAFNGCGNFNQESVITNNKIKPAINQVNINGQILIPFPFLLPNELGKPNDLTITYEFSPTKNELKKTEKNNIIFPKYFLAFNSAP